MNYHIAQSVQHPTAANADGSKATLQEVREEGCQSAFPSQERTESGQLNDPPLPPKGNTRATRTLPINLTIHWLEFTVRSGRASAKTLLAEWLGQDLDNPWSAHPTTKCRYSLAESGPHEIELLSAPLRKEAHLILTGRTCDRCQAAGLDLTRWFDKRVELTRIDLAFDGWHDDKLRPLSPKKLYKSLCADPSRIRTWAKRESIRADVGLSSGADTLYIGSKSSNRFVRIYDRRAYTRIELVLKGSHAKRFPIALSEHLKRPGMSWFNYCASELRNFVDFVKPSGNPRRAPLAKWWERGLRSVGKARHVVPRKPRLLDNKVKWLHRQAAKSLAMIVEATGSTRFLDQLVARGRQMFGPADRQFLETVPRGWQPHLEPIGPCSQQSPPNPLRSLPRDGDPSGYQGVRCEDPQVDESVRKAA